MDNRTSKVISFFLKFSKIAACIILLGTAGMSDTGRLSATGAMIRAIGCLAVFMAAFAAEKNT